MDVGVGVGETRESTEEVDRVRFEQSVVKLSEDGLLHVEDLQAGVRTGRNVLEVVDGGSVYLFVLGGDEERCDAEQL